MATNGSARSTEIREPLGKGTERARDTDAIRLFPPTGVSRQRYSGRKRKIQPDPRCTQRTIQCTDGYKAGQAYFGTGRSCRANFKLWTVKCKLSPWLNAPFLLVF